MKRRKFIGSTLAGGALLGDGNELNGLTLGGVGSGTIIDNTYRVGAGNYKYVSFSMPCTGTIQGGFIANAALGDDIKIYLLNQNQFNGYKNNENVSTYYNSGKVEYGTFDVTVNADKYYVIMSNTFSSFSTKTVQLEVSANCR